MFRVQIWYISACYLNVLLSRYILCSKVFVSKKIVESPPEEEVLWEFSLYRPYHLLVAAIFLFHVRKLLFILHLNLALSLVWQDHSSFVL